MFMPPQNDSDDEISHLEWETVRVRFVKAATLDRLVDALVTDDGELESTFVNVFLGEIHNFNFIFTHFSSFQFQLPHSDLPNVHKDGKGFGASVAAV